MITLPGRSFAVKLTILITVVSGVATGLVCAMLVMLQARSTLNAAVETAGAHARVIAANSTAALDFDDRAAALETLGGLAAVREVAAAQIDTPDGAVFARYDRAGGERTPALAEGPVARVGWRWLRLAEPIVRDGDHIGSVVLLYDLAPAQRRLLYDAAVAALVAAAVTLLSFFAARRLQRSLLRPVQELSSAAGTIASTNNYDIRARKHSDDELGVLTDVFNTMIERIREAEGIRRDHQAMLEREVARRTAEVLEAQARLRQSERMASLGTLSAGLGHDIGNILMPLRSHVASIRDGGRAGADGAEGHFEAITKAMEYLQNLSTGLRSLAQDPDRIEVPREATPLGPWWSATEPLLRAVIGSRIALEADVPGDLPPVRMSRGLLTQAVFNLVQNAAQAMTPEGGSPDGGACIHIRAAAAAGENGGRLVGLTVSDNGPGMSEEVKRRCMEPYFTTKTRRISSGLGLALVKGIVERIGGTMDVESELGVGCTFTLLLPCAGTAEGERPRVVVTIGEPRRRAVVSHLLTSLNCLVQFDGAEPASPGGEAPGEGLWITDSYDAVPSAWPGRVIVLGEAPGPTASAASPAPPGRDAGRATVLDPSTSLPILRKVLQECLPSGARS